MGVIQLVFLNQFIHKFHKYILRKNYMTVMVFKINKRTFLKLLNHQFLFGMFIKQQNSLNKIKKQSIQRVEKRRHCH